MDAFNPHYPEIGWPADHGGGPYVHKWTGLYDTYYVWLQDFQGDMTVEHFGTDGQSAIMLNDWPLLNNQAYLVKEGMWGYYKTHN